MSGRSPEIDLGISRGCVLSKTREDFWAIGSTPPDIIVSHPGKTLFELMSDGELEGFLEGLLKLKESSVGNNTMCISGGIVQTWESETARDFREALIFVYKRGRLPDRFRSEL